MFPYQKILVPLDGSPLAERALQTAVDFARAFHAELHLLRAVPIPVMVTMEPYLYDDLIRLGEEEALAYLRTLEAKITAESDVDVFTFVDNGSGAESILRYADHQKVDLIVMSSHGRSGISRWVYGSVAEKVMRHAPCATVVIRGDATVDLKDSHKILVPLDGSELAETAIEPALEMASRFHSDVILLRVTTAAHAALETAAMYPVFDQIEAQERAEAEAYLQNKFNKLPNKHLFIHVEVARQDIADAILEYAQKHEVDLIVMSSHGRSGVSRWMYGSIAERVLRAACCATLVVRGQPEIELA